MKKITIIVALLFVYCINSFSQQTVCDTPEQGAYNLTLCQIKGFWNAKSVPPYDVEWNTWDNIYKLINGKQDTGSGGGGADFSHVKPNYIPYDSSGIIYGSSYLSWGNISGIQPLINVDKTARISGKTDNTSYLELQTGIFTHDLVLHNGTSSPIDGRAELRMSQTSTGNYFGFFGNIANTSGFEYDSTGLNIIAGGMGQGISMQATNNSITGNAGNGNVQFVATGSDILGGIYANQFKNNETSGVGYFNQSTSLTIKAPIVNDSASGAVNIVSPSFEVSGNSEIAGQLMVDNDFTMTHTFFNTSMTVYANNTSAKNALGLNAFYLYVTLAGDTVVKIVH